MYYRSDQATMGMMKQYQRPRQLLSVAALCLALIIAVFAPGRQCETLENGLEMDTTKAGDCSAKAHTGSTIEVHYKGMLMDGTEFDESYKRGKPFEIELGRGMVIAGWEMGLQGMCLGEERTLIIPPTLGYGSRNMGAIPPDSTLKFETKMMSIDGQQAVDASPEAVDKPTGSEADKAGDYQGDDLAEEGKLSSHGDKAPGKENGQCKLLGPFALFVQAGLGVLALLSLVWKRWRERPRRPVKVWFFDVSKQVVGAVMVHFVNLLMSELPGTAGLDNQSQVEQGLDKPPNPCSFYLINIAVDTTIGIAILVLLLKVLHRAAAMTPLANPPESIKSGHYGQPPKAMWWFKQSIIYFVGLLLMKLCVFLIFKIIPWIVLVGDWALGWTEGNEGLQIAFVMFVFPLVMNGIQYYIIDSFIKDPAAGEHEAIPTEADSDDDMDDESRQPLHRATSFDEERTAARASEDEFKRS